MFLAPLGSSAVDRAVGLPAPEPGRNHALGAQGNVSGTRVDPSTARSTGLAAPQIAETIVPPET